MKERGNAKLKFFDKFIGIPLVFILGLLRKKNKETSINPQNMIIVMIAAIGDTILLSSIIKELKHLYPNVQYYTCLFKWKYASCKKYTPYKSDNKV